MLEPHITHLTLHHQPWYCCPLDSRLLIEPGTGLTTSWTDPAFRQTTNHLVLPRSGTVQGSRTGSQTVRSLDGHYATTSIFFQMYSLYTHRSTVVCPCNLEEYRCMRRWFVMRNTLVENGNSITWLFWWLVFMRRKLFRNRSTMLKPAVISPYNISLSMLRFLRQINKQLFSQWWFS